MRGRLTLLCLFVFALALQPMFAQQQTDLQKALMTLEQRAEGWGLQAADVIDIAVSDQYVARHNGASHFYFAQRYAGIPLYNAINGVHLNRDGEVIMATNNFQADVAARINTTTPTLTPEQALHAAVEQLNLTTGAELVLKDRTAGKFTFSGADFSDTDVTVQLRYMPMRETGEIRLAWDMAIDVAINADYWSVRIDALDGKLLHQHNYTVYCNFDAKAGHTAHANNCVHENSVAKAPMRSLDALTTSDGAGYHVHALPAESPIHGDRVIVTEPSDPVASPFGWHDTDGMEGPEYTITRGNNVHAYLDVADQNSSQNDEPDGGEELYFDFYFDIDDEPENMQDAAVTQLFYMNNMMHDITYRYGFTEEGGNFQRNNYGNGGDGLDHVFAEAQDGSGTNNANFSTPPDGANGRMQMYRWFGVEGSVLSFSEPEIVAGSYSSGTAQYGPMISDVPITGQVVRAFDGSGAPNLVCEAVANVEEVAGKIAMIDRGDCFFEEKTLNAQEAGAIAVIICNYLEEALGMAGGVDNDEPTIVTVSMAASDCNAIKMLIDEGETVTATIVLPEDSGPESVGSSMDNGVIAHEYGHGISNRLTGGPNSAGCLGNDEQMGEGWSDFFALITTVRPGDEGGTKRGIGNYSDRQPADGNGIRRLPYSTDLNINDHDMDDIIATAAPHPLGEVWNTAIWDLYWAMVDVYGFDDDVINGTGGNNMAIQLVMDGMALQGCEPGIISGRDGIIGADFLNYDGIHECLIYEVFARRGMGIDADQNSRFDRNDNVAGFNVPAFCIKELQISKTADRGLIVAGESVEFTITVANFKDEAATGVMVEDQLPDGLTYEAGSATGATVTDNGATLTFDVGDLGFEDEVVITYRAISSADNRSVRLFYDDMENGDDNWEIEVGSGFDIWDLSNANPNSGETSWFVANVAEQNDQILVLSEAFEVNGTNPSLRFYHDYNTGPVTDGGFVQISTNGGFSWENVNEAYIRNAYRGDLAAQTLFTPGIEAFWGDSDGYVDSYIDLSAYQGQTIQVRFRFASNADGAANGWYLDDVEVMDKVAYEGEACVSSNEGDTNCAIVANGGVIVDTEFSESTEEPVNDPTIMQVYPNPAGDVLNVAIAIDLAANVDVQLINAGGAVVRQWKEQALQGRLMSLNVSDLPAGFYFLQVNTDQGIYTEKVTIQ